MAPRSIPPPYPGWWRIIETSQWVDHEPDIIGPALISFTGYDDRLRMLCLLAYVSCRPTKAGVSFTWEGGDDRQEPPRCGRASWVTVRRPTS